MRNAEIPGWDGAIIDAIILVNVSRFGHFVLFSEKEELFPVDILDPISFKVKQQNTQKINQS